VTPSPVITNLLGKVSPPKFDCNGTERVMEELHTDSIDGGHEASYWARSRARGRRIPTKGPWDPQRAPSSNFNGKDEIERRKALLGT
jgi:hypothetical protein